jgi:hypothetical protein
VEGRLEYSPTGPDGQKETMEMHTNHADPPELEFTDFVAVVLSIFAPGLGHVILGQVMKGVVIMVLTILSCGVGYIVSALIALDAFMVARARHTRPVGDWEIFPEYRAVFARSLEQT